MEAMMSNKRSSGPWGVPSNRSLGIYMRRRRSSGRAVLVFAALAWPVAVVGAPVVPPKGGAAIVLKSPVWLTGVSSSGQEGALAPYAEDFPPPVQTEHLKVVNAGYWLANLKKPSQVVYEFTMTVTKPFDSRVYTRVLLEDPSARDSPIKYEHYLDPAERSTRVTHGPLSGVKRGEKYTFSFEVFSDEARTTSVERIVQSIVSPLDNSGGCVELRPEVMAVAFPSLTSGTIPIEKIMLACDR